MSAKVKTWPDFGSYVLIEQKRYGAKNEMYLYKVISRLRSNTYVQVPVDARSREPITGDLTDVVSCICCGVDTTNN